MKSCFNILRGFIAFFFTVLYWMFLSISFLILPISFILKDSRSLNIALDDIRIEEQIAYLLTGTADPATLEPGTEIETPEIDFSAVFDDVEIQKALIDTRRDIVVEAYKSIEQNTPLNYEVDLDFFNTLYVGVMTEYFNSLPVCTAWPTDLNLEISMDSGCLPAPIALANGIELPDTVVVPSNFEITDNLLIENIVDYQAAVDAGTAELPVIRIEQDVISSLNPIQTILENYVTIFAITFLVLTILIIIIFPGFKAI
ncbi:MAG: hypothetical protein ABIC57_01170, partial [bacterium]